MPTASTDARLPYQLRIGVTGHRDLPNPAAVADAVDRLLEQIETCLTRRRNTEIEWTSVTMGARGADRLVADAVLKRKLARVELVAPFDIQKYEADFTPGPELDHFRRLKEVSATSIPVINSDPEFPANQQQRDLGYLNAGRAICDTSEILIAIWDRDLAKGVGGTGDVVRYAVEGEGHVFWIDSRNPGAPVRRLIRGNSESRHAVSGSGLRVSTQEVVDKPVRWRAATLSRGYLQHDRFANHPIQHHESCLVAIEEQRRVLRELASRHGVPHSTIEPIEQHILPHEVRADALATRWQWWHAVASSFVFGASAAAVTVAVLRLAHYTTTAWLVAAEVVIMLAAVIVVFLNRSLRVHENWLHARYLAEQTRTARFAALAGADFSVMSVTREVSQSLPFYSGPQSWVPAITGQMVALARRPLPEAHFEGLKQMIVHGWHHAQSRWHHDNCHNKESWSARLHGFVLIALILTLTLATIEWMEVRYGEHATVQHVAGANVHPVTRPATAAIAKLPHEPGHTSEFSVHIPSPWNWLITVATIALPACAAAAHGISKQLEFERIAARSHRMEGVLEQLAELAESAATPRQLLDVVNRTMRVITTENYEWWVLLSFDPPEYVL